MTNIRALPLIGRLLRGTRAESQIPLDVKSEFALLPDCSGVADFIAHRPTPSGALLKLVEAIHIDGTALKAQLDGHMAGESPPPGHDGASGALMAGVSAGRVREAYYMPEYGAVITGAGEVIECTIAEARYLTPTLAALPGVSMSAEGPQLTISRKTPTIDRASVFMAWGGRFNYGHFLIDCLSALAALDEQGLLDRWRPIAPPLNEWQRQGLRLFLGDDRASKVRETREPMLRVNDLLFSTPMNHFLHAPNKPLDLVRRRMSDAVRQGPPGPARLYVNRRNDTKRPMVNEEELEAALAAQGFVSVAPERMPLSEQIALFRDADVIVAPTGAALANVLFCKPGAKVFEIQPSNFVGIWTRQIAHFVGADWYGFFSPSPLSETPVHIEGMERPGLLFRWAAPIPEIMAWINSGLTTASTPALRRASA